MGGPTKTLARVLQNLEGARPNPHVQVKSLANDRLGARGIPKSRTLRSCINRGIDAESKKSAVIVGPSYEANCDCPTLEQFDRMLASLGGVPHRPRARGQFRKQYAALLLECRALEDETNWCRVGWDPARRTINATNFPEVTFQCLLNPSDFLPP